MTDHLALPSLNESPPPATLLPLAAQSSPWFPSPSSSPSLTEVVVTLLCVVERRRPHHSQSYSDVTDQAIASSPRRRPPSADQSTTSKTKKGATLVELHQCFAIILGSAVVGLVLSGLVCLAVICFAHMGAHPSPSRRPSLPHRNSTITAFSVSDRTPEQKTSLPLPDCRDAHQPPPLSVPVGTPILPPLLFDCRKQITATDRPCVVARR